MTIVIPQMISSPPKTPAVWQIVSTNFYRLLWRRIEYFYPILDAIALVAVVAADGNYVVEENEAATSYFQNLV